MQAKAGPAPDQPKREAVIGGFPGIVGRERHWRSAPLSARSAPPARQPSRMPRPPCSDPTTHDRARQVSGHVELRIQRAERLSHGMGSKPSVCSTRRALPGVNKQSKENMVTKRKRRHRRSVDVRINWLQPHVDGFKDWLSQRNYSPTTIIEVVRLLALWADWVRAAGFEVETLAAGFAASASVFRGSKTTRAPQGAAALFIAYLREKNVLPPERQPSLEETWPTLAAFRRWMREQRGVKDSTLDTYQAILVDLLGVARRRSGGLHGSRDPRLRARSREAARTRAGARHHRRHARLPQVSGGDRTMPGRPGTRCSELRELAVGDDAALPRASRYRPPSCRLRRRGSVARPGRHPASCPSWACRASEVANLTFDDIDWVNGRITLAGKARREERLPLTQEIGDAILAYIERARPRVATTRVFLTRAAPVRPLSRIAVKCIVRRALDRAGDQERPSWCPCSAPLRGHGDAAQRRQPRRRRRRAAAPLAVGHGALRQGGHRPPVGDRAALGREAAMLSDDADRYISLRRTLGYKLVKAARHLRAFARFAAGAGRNAYPRRIRSRLAGDSRPDAGRSRSGA